MEAVKVIKTHWLYMFNKHHNFRKMISHSKTFKVKTKYHSTQTLSTIVHEIINIYIELL